MDQWQREGLDRLERSGYLPTLREWVRALCAPFWWYDDHAAVGESIRHNGTVCFVDTGTEVLSITAAHVLDDYLEDLHRSPSIKCQFGSATIEPEGRVIASHSGFDIATMSLPNFLVTATHRQAHRAVRWPPPPLIEGELVILGGYPGRLRRERDAEADFPFVSFIGRVTQASADHVALYLDLPNSHWPQGVALVETDLGGASGGPVFRIRSEVFDRLEFAGIVYQSSQTFEIVRARQAGLISPSGAIVGATGPAV